MVASERSISRAAIPGGERMGVGGENERWLQAEEGNLERILILLLKRMVLILKGLVFVTKEIKMMCLYTLKRKEE